MDVQADFKSPPRIRDRTASAKKLHRDRRCRSSCGNDATQAHHIVRRSRGGDDVVENLMPLCTECHVLFHSKGPMKLRLNLDELQYVETKLGADAGRAYLERHYLWSESV